MSFCKNWLPFDFLYGFHCFRSCFVSCKHWLRCGPNGSSLKFLLCNASGTSTACWQPIACTKGILMKNRWGRSATNAYKKRSMTWSNEIHTGNQMEASFYRNSWKSMRFRSQGLP
jgi:hypothetical protein